MPRQHSLLAQRAARGLQLSVLAAPILIVVALGLYMLFAPGGVEVVRHMFRRLSLLDRASLWAKVSLALFVVYMIWPLDPWADR